MELDLGSHGLFYTSLEDVDVSTVHENRRFAVSGTWVWTPPDEEEPVKLEAVLSVLLDEFPPPEMENPKLLLNLGWEEFQIEIKEDPRILLGFGWEEFQE